MALSIRTPRALAALLIGAAAFVSLSAPAIAAMPAAPSVSVRFNDLDISTDAGQAVLRARIEGAAKDVCGVIDNRDLAATGRVMACRRMAAEGALARVERATALAHNSHRNMPMDGQPVVGMR